MCSHDVALQARNTEMQPFNAEMNPYDGEMFACNVEMFSDNAEIHPKNVEISTNDAEDLARNAEICAKDVELYPGITERCGFNVARCTECVESGLSHAAMKTSDVEIFASSPTPRDYISTTSRHISTPFQIDVEMYSFIAAPKSFSVAICGSSSTLDRCDAEKCAAGIEMSSGDVAKSSPNVELYSLNVESYGESVEKSLYLSTLDDEAAPRHVS